MRVRQALEDTRCGARLVGYAEREDGYRVEFAVGDERTVSLIEKGDLTVQVAGVCLSGEDRRFDLASLVGVLREAAGTEAPRVGADNGGMNEEWYWEVHPPPG